MQEDNVYFVKSNKYQATYQIQVQLYMYFQNCTRDEAEYFLDCKLGINCY